MRFYRLALLLFSLSASAEVVSPPTLLRQVYDHFPSLSSEQREFLQIYLDTVGLRAFLSGPEQFRPMEQTPQALRFRNFESSKNLEIHFGAPAPKVKSREKERVLELPHNFDWRARGEDGPNLIRHFLFGHSLHPYNTKNPLIEKERQDLQEPALFLKEAQVQAQMAVRSAIARGDKRFLFVAPTGTGKTEVMMEALRASLQHNRQQKIIFVVTDQTELVSQLAKDIRATGLGRPIMLEEWSSRYIKLEDRDQPDGKVPARSMEELIALAEKSDRPIIVATPIKSLESRLAGPNFAKNLEKLRRLTGMIAYDEAHHSGAPVASKIFDEWINHPYNQTVLYGTTATPVRKDQNLELLYQNHAFWAGLDKATDYLAQGGRANRDIDAILDQLAYAMRRGELMSLDKTIFVPPTAVASDGSSVFRAIKAENGVSTKYVIDEKKEADLVHYLKPIMDRHKQGFISVSTIEEAERLVETFRRLNPHRRFEVMHGGTPSEVRKNFKEAFAKGEIDFIITPKLFDEGLNFPNLTLYIDANRSVGPRQFLQRLGRILRPAMGKEKIDVVTLSEVDEHSLREQLILMKRLNRGDFASPFIEHEAEEALPHSGGMNRIPLTRAEVAANNRQYRELLHKFWQDSRISPLEVVEQANQLGHWPDRKNPNEKRLEFELRRLALRNDDALDGLEPKLREEGVRRQILGSLEDRLNNFINKRDVGPSKTSRIAWHRKLAQEVESALDEGKLRYEKLHDRTLEILTDSQEALRLQKETLAWLAQPSKDFSLGLRLGEYYQLSGQLPTEAPFIEELKQALRQRDPSLREMPQTTQKALLEAYGTAEDLFDFHVETHGRVPGSSDGTRFRKAYKEVQARAAAGKLDLSRLGELSLDLLTRPDDPKVQRQARDRALLGATEVPRDFGSASVAKTQEEFRMRVHETYQNFPPEQRDELSQILRGRAETLPERFNRYVEIVGRSPRFMTYAENALYQALRKLKESPRPEILNRFNPKAREIYDEMRLALRKVGPYRPRKGCSQIAELGT